jgi:excinuclease ABC subunit A
MFLVEGVKLVKEEGEVTVDMQFLADVHLVCEACNGTRYKREALEFTYHGKKL